MSQRMLIGEVHCGCGAPRDGGGECLCDLCGSDWLIGRGVSEPRPVTVRVRIPCWRALLGMGRPSPRFSRLLPKCAKLITV